MELEFQVTILSVGEIIESSLHPGEMAIGMTVSLDDQDKEPMIVTLPISKKQAQHLGARVLEGYNMKVVLTPSP